MPFFTSDKTVSVTTACRVISLFMTVGYRFISRQHRGHILRIPALRNPHNCQFVGFVTLVSAHRRRYVSYMLNVDSLTFVVIDLDALTSAECIQCTKATQLSCRLSRCVHASHVAGQRICAVMTRGLAIVNSHIDSSSSMTFLNNILTNIYSIVVTSLTSRHL